MSPHPASILQDDTWMRARVMADDGRYDGFIEEVKQLCNAQYKTLLNQIEQGQTVTRWVDFLHTNFVITMARLRMEGGDFTYYSIAYHYYLDLLITLYPIVTASTQAEILLVIESIPNEHKRILECLKLFPYMQLEQRKMFIEKSLALSTILADEYEQQEIYRGLLPYLSESQKNDLQPNLLAYALSFRTGDVWEDGDAYMTCISFISEIILGANKPFQQKAVNILWDIVQNPSDNLFLWHDLSKVISYLSKEQQIMVCQTLVEYIRLVCEGKKEISPFYSFKDKFSRIFPYFSDEQHITTLNRMIAFGKSECWQLTKWFESIPAYIPAAYRKQILEILWESDIEDFAFCVKFLDNILPYSTEIERQQILKALKTPTTSLLLTHAPQFWASLDSDDYQAWIQKFQRYLLTNRLKPEHYDFVLADEFLHNFYSQIPLFPSGIFQAHEIDQITQNLIQVCTHWKWI